MEQKQCPKCASLNAPTFKFCARCGTPLSAAAAPPKVAGWPAANPAVAATKAAPPRPAVASGAPNAAPARPRARISAIARDGSRSADYVLTRPETRVGSAVDDAEVKLDKDPYVAPAHALFKFEGDQLTIRDLGTQNGVFLWLRERELESAASGCESSGSPRRPGPPPSNRCGVARIPVTSRAPCSSSKAAAKATSFP